jgi:hypothetical protein
MGNMFIASEPIFSMIISSDFTSLAEGSSVQVLLQLDETTPIPNSAPGLAQSIYSDPVPAHEAEGHRSNPPASASTPCRSFHSTLRCNYASNKMRGIFQHFFKMEAL